MHTTRGEHLVACALCYPLTHFSLAWPYGHSRFYLEFKENSGLNGLNKKSKFLQGPVSPNFCARRSVMMILNLSKTLAKPLVMAKLNMAYLSSLKNQQNCCRPTAKPAKLLSSYLPVSPSRVLRAPALHRTIWCRSTFGPRGPGLSNPTSFLRPALPMAPTRDDNARDKRSVLRPEPSDILKGFRAL